MNFIIVWSSTEEYVVATVYTVHLYTLFIKMKSFQFSNARASSTENWALDECAAHYLFVKKITRLQAIKFCDRLCPSIRNG